MAGQNVRFFGWIKLERQPKAQRTIEVLKMLKELAETKVTATIR